MQRTAPLLIPFVIADFYHLIVLGVCASGCRGHKIITFTKIYTTVKVDCGSASAWLHNRIISF